MTDNMRLLTSAGAETTGTTLVTATYFLCTHPEVLTKLNFEIRSTFKSEGEIDFNSVQSLTYLGAVISETMRVHPAGKHHSSRSTVPHPSCLGTFQNAIPFDQQVTNKY